MFLLRVVLAAEGETAKRSGGPTRVLDDERGTVAVRVRGGDCRRVPGEILIRGSEPTHTKGGMLQSGVFDVLQAAAME
jgi:hypothetical protein